MTPDELKDHAFSKAVFISVLPVINAGFEYRQNHGRKAEYDLDEHEFYLMRVGNRLSTLISHCEQLSHSVLLISNYRHTTAMSQAGITRIKHLRYSIESYIIRTQTLYDLVLKLIDAVFHLQNSDAQCREEVIIKNLKVMQTDVPKVLKPLRKKLSEFEQARHSVVHHGIYQDDDIFLLEMFSELKDGFQKSGDTIPAELAFTNKEHAERTRLLIKQRKDQYKLFNSQILKLLSDIFVVLYKRFEKEEKRLSMVIGKKLL